MKKHWSDIVFFVVLMVGIGFLAYPTISNYVNDLNQTRAVASYKEKSDDLSQHMKAVMFQAAQAYNVSLLQRGPLFHMNALEKKEYESILDVSKTGIMGYVEIPKIDVLLPIYHGIDAGILQIAIGHIPGTSFPIGGTGTHSVLSGHRGLPSAKLFTRLDELKQGDIFVIHVLDEHVAYKVDRMDVVRPEQTDSLAIVPDKDYCTLVTCTPYGVNSHRLLVRGERTAYVPQDDIQHKVKVKEWKLLGWIVMVVALVLGLAIGYLWWRKKQKGRRSSE